MSKEGTVTEVEGYTDATRRWGKGPWEGEPDYVEYFDNETGYTLVMARSFSGAWCGYVGIPESHPWHGIKHDQCVKGGDIHDCGHTPERMIKVHGGITYSGRSMRGRDVGGDRLWWFGFDCNHGFDASPKSPETGEYRDITYVTIEAEGLAEQLLDVANEHKADGGK